jgi:hypothetical protein
MKNELRAIHIEKSDNGGHIVRHEFEPKASHDRYGVGMRHVPDETHAFGKDEGTKLAEHIRGALKLKGGDSEEC